MIIVGHALSLLFAVQLGAAELTPEGGTTCPDAARVSSALMRVAPERPEVRVGWRRRGERLVVSVERASPPLAVERELPLASCDELADAIALVVERAVSPLESAEASAPVALRKVERPAPEASPPPAALRGAGPALAIHAGPYVTTSGGLAVGAAVGAEAWWTAVPVGAATVLGGNWPREYGRAGADLELFRGFVGAGAAARPWRTERFELGTSLMGLITLTGGRAGGLEEARRIRDLRAGGRLAGWVSVVQSRFELRLEVAGRAFPSARRYTELPAGELAHFSAVEGEFFLALGLRSGG